MPVKDQTEGTSIDYKAENEALKAQLDEAQKIVETLNKRLTRVIRLYNMMVDLYVQGENQQ